MIGRDFAASGPNQKWFADLTHVPTRQGSLHLAVVMDALQPADRGPGDARRHARRPASNAGALDDLRSPRQGRCCDGRVNPGSMHRCGSAARFDDIESVYDPRRRHSALGCLSPDEFERRHAEHALAEAAAA
ncbi:MAG: hypothetical protein K2X91_05920 [Thermoleophilia bacterium]|nr:hypothetical protein [Thermoleophilia bacterium]